MTEEWRVIEDFPDYAVSNLGRVKRTKDNARGNVKAGIMLRQNLKRNGYLQVTLTHGQTTKSIGVHRIVLFSFHGLPINGQQANHKDGNKQNNSIFNLEWVSPSENRFHSYAIGTSKTESIKGENHGNSRFKSGEIWLIKRLLASRRISQSQIAMMFKTNQSYISSISVGKVWCHIALDRGSI